MGGGESDHPAFGPTASLSLQLVSSSITPAGSVPGVTMLHANTTALGDRLSIFETLYRLPLLTFCVFVIPGSNDLSIHEVELSGNCLQLQMPANRDQLLS